MRNEISDLELSKVAGGNYYVNKNNKKMAFDTIDGVYQLTDACSCNQAMDLMDGLIGKYHTVKEYDEACLDLLTRKGWIVKL